VQPGFSDGISIQRNQPAPEFQSKEESETQSQGFMAVHGTDRLLCKHLKMGSTFVISVSPTTPARALLVVDGGVGKKESEGGSQKLGKRELRGRFNL
jgi:hypothetical protein